MGGTSKTSQTQSSTTQPWTEAQPALQGILGQLQGNLGNTGVTGAESGALTTLVNNGNNATAQYAQPIADFAKTLLGGGGATDQAGNVNQGYQDYARRLSATANGEMIGNNPALQAQLDAMRSDITNNVNGSFAAAGRDFSGANFNTLGRGIATGLAPVIAGQYNTDVANQRSAADALYGGSNTNAGILAGLQQQKLSNQGQGVTAAGAATDAANAGANATLQAEAQRRGIPVQALGLLAQIGIPIAGLGSQSTGQSQGTQQMSGAQQFATIAGGLGSLFGGGSSGGSTASNIFKMISDRRLKTDIHQIGAASNGLPLYVFRYISDPSTQHIGVMAQDVLGVNPDAVSEENGHYVVDYAKALR